CAGRLARRELQGSPPRLRSDTEADLRPSRRRATDTTLGAGRTRTGGRPLLRGHSPARSRPRAAPEAAKNCDTNKQHVEVQESTAPVKRRAGIRQTNVSIPAGSLLIGCGGRDAF